MGKTNCPPSTPEARRRWDYILDALNQSDRAYSTNELAQISESEYGATLRTLKLMESQGMVRCEPVQISKSRCINMYSLANGDATYNQRERKLQYRKCENPFFDPKHGKARLTAYLQLRRKGIGEGRALMESFRRYPNN